MFRRFNKYGRKKVTDIAGRRFDSKLEHSVFQILLLHEKAGLITDIVQQVTIDLISGIRYRPDFQVFDKELNDIVYVEAKGLNTDVWSLKLKLYRDFGIKRLRLYKGTHKSPKLVEEIIPKGLITCQGV